DERVGDGDLSSLAIGPQVDTLGQKFEIDLVHDADIRRHDAEVIESLLTPAEKFVPLAIAGELQIDVELQGLILAEVIDLDRVIDHQIDRNQGVDAAGIALQTVHGAAHGGQIDHAGHAGKILQYDSSRLERDFDLRRGDG